MLRRFFLLFISALFASTAHAVATPESFAPMLEPLMPAVVNISTTQKVNVGGGMQFGFPDLPDDPQFAPFRDMFQQFQQQQQQPMEREVTSLGSGFVIDPTGYIVTNNHVIANAADVTVIFSDNKRLTAKPVGYDPQTDLALLKVKTDKPLPYVKFGESDALKVGDWVVAVGNPFGLGGSVSAGIVSARGRNINAGPFDDFIQTDAAINRGNSGGPLFNIRGEVVGINSAIFSPTGGNVGIGFAVPSSLAKPIIQQLKTNGKTQRGWLGVKIQEVSEETAEALGMKSPRGALVLEVEGPAKGSGLEPGDVIVRFNGQEVGEMRRLPRLVADTKPGTKVEVTVWKKGRETTHSVKVGELPMPKGKSAKLLTQENESASPVPGGETVLGMKLAPLTEAIRAQTGIPKKVEGLLVISVDRTGNAAKHGIQGGDVISEVNQTEVDSLRALRTEIEKAKDAGRDYVLFKVTRREGSLFVTVPTK